MDRNVRVRQVIKGLPDVEVKDVPRKGRVMYSLEDIPEL